MSEKRKLELVLDCNGVITFAHYKNPAKISVSLAEIKARNPCTNGWKQLVQFLASTTKGDNCDYNNNTQIDYRVFLKSNGIHDTLWAWRCKWFEGKDIWIKVVNAALKRSKKYASASASYADADADAASAAYASTSASYADAADAAYASAAAAAYAAAAYAADADAAADYADAADADAERRLQTKHLLMLLS